MFSNHNARMHEFLENQKSPLVAQATMLAGSGAREGPILFTPVAPLRQAHGQQVKLPVHPMGHLKTSRHLVEEGQRSPHSLQAPRKRNFSVLHLQRVPD
jgi:hypothetical protein